MRRATAGYAVTEGLEGARGTTHDSMLVAAGTALSRASGVVRVLAVGAVLGPTYFGNAYQVTNSLPNLIYYGFLAGSLVSSLLVPVLVRHIDARNPRGAAAVGGGFLGVLLTGGLVLFPVAVLGVPWLLQLATLGSAADDPTGQVGLARVLVVMTVPQVFLYAVAGTAAAVMNAHRRFALAAVAPALENLGIIAVLGAVALTWGVARADTASVPTGELVLLGLGSTGAVALHASVQWWGARRCGVVVRPARGWRDPEVRAVLRRALPALAQAGLLAAQLLVLMLVASRVAGGSVALQIAINFYSLPVALIATPVGLALLPRLARIHQRGEAAEFQQTFLEGVRLAIFVAAPASAGYVALAVPIAHVVGVGQMGTAAGYAMIAGALTALAAGLLGQTVFFVCTQACYARQDTRTPLACMGVQAAVCVGLCAVAVVAGEGPRLLTLLGGAYAVASLAGGVLLLLRVVPVSAPALRHLGRALLRVLAGVGTMLVPVVGAVLLSRELAGGRPGWLLALVSASVVGVLAYGGAQALLRSPELGWVRAGVGGPRATAEGEPS